MAERAVNEQGDVTSTATSPEEDKEGAKQFGTVTEGITEHLGLVIIGTVSHA
jgi:hypothetical protein